MPHQVESDCRIPVTFLPESDLFASGAAALADCLFLGVPPVAPRLLRDAHRSSPGLSAANALDDLCQRVACLAATLPDGSELALYGDPLDLSYLLASLPPGFRYHLWAAVRTDVADEGGLFAGEHRSLLLLGKGVPSLRHARVRVAYQFCPACDRTTKDYGGRKHLYDAYGTLLSDVWKDEAAVRSEALPGWVVDRVRGLMSAHGRHQMLAAALEERGGALANRRDTVGPLPPCLPAGARAAITRPPIRKRWADGRGELWNADALDALPRIEDGSVDVVFADPPYNLAKRYAGGGDARREEEYLAWCRAWIAACCRVLRPGGILALLNLPVWCADHLRLAHEQLEFLSWVVWESMSLPAREIMPSHYALVLLRKPGGDGPGPSAALAPREGEDLLALKHGYCLRPGCIRRRDAAEARQRATDLWCDIHRLKHNTHRWDHPCQLPPRLMRRLIAAATRPGDRVLDPFNGIGTTTLTAAMMGRGFVGIEIERQYFAIARERHQVLRDGGDPFAPRGKTPQVKNNQVRRQPRKAYPVPKKTIQLEMRRLAARLGRMPTRSDALEHLPYAAEVYSACFKSWSEVLAAARTTGMQERRPQS